MSKHNRERKRRAVIMRDKNAAVLSQKTLAKVADFNSRAVPGRVNHVGVFHEAFCAKALRSGAAKCVCEPDVRLLDPGDTSNPADRRAMENLGLLPDSHAE